MKRKMYLVLLVAFMSIVMMTGCAKKAGAQSVERNTYGEYPIGLQIQVIGVDDKPIDKKDAYFTYLPSTPTDLERQWAPHYDNVVILNHILSRTPLLTEQAFFFGRGNNATANNIGFFRDCIDKAIEWAATAKQNKVNSLSKEIVPDGYNLDDITIYSRFRNERNFERMYVTLALYIGEIDDKGNEGTLLVMYLRTQNQMISGGQGRVYYFSENDFAHLKEIFSESYLAEIDKKEADWQKSHADQDSLFE